MTLQEAADAMGVCLKTAARTEQNALDKLRKGLEEFRDYTPPTYSHTRRVSRRPM